MMKANKAKALAFIERGKNAEASNLQSSEGWLPHVSGQMAQWFGDIKGCITSLTAAVKEARSAGNTPCEVMSLCMMAYTMARTGDLDGARDLVTEVNKSGQALLPPTLMGYIHYARGGIARDPKLAVDEYQTTAEWARMAGNALGVQRVKQLIADLLASNAAPAEALDIHVQSLIELPSHGATFYTWLTIRSLILPLSELEADEVVAVLAGALKHSPLRLDRATRNAVEKAATKLGNRAFEDAAARGSRFDPAEARRYIIEVWRGMTAGRAQSKAADI